jgi:hypothetical protein
MPGMARKAARSSSACAEPRLFDGAQAEDGERRHHGHEAHSRKTAGRRHHVLLGDAELQETVGMRLAEMMRARAARDVGIEHDKLREFVSELRQSLAEGFAQGIAARADQGGGGIRGRFHRANP